MTSSGLEDSRTKYKQQAAERAVMLVESGMVVGLGSGSTAIFATRRIAEMIREEELWDITAFATSKAVLREAIELGIPMIAEDMQRSLDITIDGADEVDPRLNLIKGGGGALLREKVAAQASQREVIVVDDTKISPFLGLRFAVPIEVLAYGWRSQFRFLESIGAQVSIRYNEDKSEFRTDSGNMIFDCEFGPIHEPAELAATLCARAGIVEHGLFVGLATDVIVAGTSGIRHLEANVRT
jgi:ribose 5-phosphate isomerase A